MLGGLPSISRRKEGADGNIDISKVWDRLFDHKGFLSGEINFTLKELEEKRDDTDVDSLFSTIENITEIRDTQIRHLKEVVNEKLIEANQQLSTSLELCSQFAELEENCSQNTVLEENQIKRKAIWNTFMDEITSEYSTINTQSEKKEREIRNFYEDLERKLQ